MTSDPRDAFQLTRELVLTARDDRSLRRAAENGSAVRLHRGAYMDAAVWAEVDRFDRYRLRVFAALAASRGRPIASHHSAAAVWGIPLLGPEPKHVHVLSTIATGTRKEGQISRHATSDIDSFVVDLDGVTVTDFDRTLVELASRVDFATAVAAFDWALRPSTNRDPKPSTSKARLLQMAENLSIQRGLRNVVRSIEFADGLSGSPGESESRVTIFECGFPAPSLQCRFDDRSGLIGFTDFGWPAFGLVGEFDGLVKYTRGAFGTTRSLEEIVVAEKIREDRIRALGPGVVRWLSSDLRPASRLTAKLLDAGLPRQHGFNRGRAG